MKNIRLKLLLAVLVLFSCTLFFPINKAKAIYKEVKSTTISMTVVSAGTTTYEVTFNAMGGSFNNQNDSTRIVTSGDPVGQLPTVTKPDNNFMGWFTQNGVEINSYETITGDITFYAHWQPIMCLKAAVGTLHTETCDLSDGPCRYNSLYDANNTTIYYGTIYGQNQVKPLAGNAYDCDVDANGTYDPVGERFYFIREDENEITSLIYYTSIDEQGPVDTQDTVTWPNGGNSFLYDDALTYLPTSSEWTNSSLRDLDGNGKVTRFLNRDDVVAACGAWTVGGAGYIDSCPYLQENSRYQDKQKGRAGIWMEKDSSVTDPPGKSGYRLQTESRNVGNVYANNLTSGNDKGSLNTARPVIEIPISALEGYQYREKYTVSFNSMGGTAVSSIERRSGEPIGSLTSLVPTKQDSTFVGWFLDDGQTQVTSSTVITGNITFYAHWVNDPKVTVFHIPGTCTFNGSGTNISSPNNDCISTVNPTGSAIDYVNDGSYKYIKTGIPLYNTTNINQDYEIGFTIVSYSPSANANRATIMNSKAEVDETSVKYPGVVFRRNETTDNLLLQHRKTLSANEEQTFGYGDVQTVKIIRENGVIKYSINGGADVGLMTIGSYNPTFDLDVWFGASPTDDTATVAQRHFIGTLSNLYIKLKPISHTVTFDTRGGSANPSNITVNDGDTIGTQMPPDPTKTDYYFDGWYDSTTFSTANLITASTQVNNDIDCYAKWVQSINNATIASSMNVAVGANETISITGTDIESVTYQSSDTTKATVDANGQVHGVAAGSATITITGTKSGDTYQVTVNVLTPTYTVTFKDGNTVVDTVSVTSGSTIGNRIPTPDPKTNYVFDHWYLENYPQTIISSSTQVTGDMVALASWKEKVNIANVSNVTVAEGSTATITVTASVQGEEVESYTFASSDPTVATVNQTTGEVTGVAAGSATVTITGASGATNQSTITVTAVTPEYTVTFKDGNTVVDTVNVTSGSTIGNQIPTPDPKTNYVFDHWYLENYPQTIISSSTQVTGDMVALASWKEKVNIANVSNVTVAEGSTATITVTASVQGEEVESYTFASSDPTVATVNQTTGEVTGVAAGITTVTITGASGATNQSTITVTAQANSHTVSFKKEETDTVAYATMTVNHGAALDSLPAADPTKTNYAFAGWYTDASGGSPVTTATVINGDVTFFAHWDLLICRKATSLHTSGSVTFGTIPVNDEPEGGYAYDCDVNGDGIYDATDERFYYLTTDENGYAVLIYSNNTHQNSGSLETICNADGLKYSLDITTGPLGSELPETSQWSNVSLHSTPRQLLNENGTTAYGNSTLGTTSYTGKAARFATIQEISEATGLSISTITTAGGLKDTSDASKNMYLFENVKYLQPSGTSPDCRSNYWLESPKASGASYVFRINGGKNTELFVGNQIGNSDKYSGTRPVIEVEARLIGIPRMYTVTFNSQSGSAVPSRKVVAGAQLGTLPEDPTKTDNIFDGWYTDTNWNTQVTSSTVITDNVTFYAKWIPTIHNATFSPSSVELDVAETQQISVSGAPTGMESYSYSSLNTSIATVSNSGLITAVSTGTTTIRITGASSNTHVDITVTVGGGSPTDVTVTFDNDGTLTYKTVELDGYLGDEMPDDPPKSGYIFVGWFIDGNINHEFTRDTQVSGNITVVAEWTANTNVARIGSTYYQTFKAAIDAVPDTNTPTEIVILQDTTASNRPQLAANENAVIKGGSYTVSASGDNVLYVNGGTATIVSGTFESGVTSKGVMDTSTTGKLYITGGTLRNTNDRGAVYNAGYLEISGDAHLSSVAADRPVVHNYTASSEVKVLGGTIEQTNGSCTRGAIQNEKSGGKVTILGGTIKAASTNTNAGGIRMDAGTLVIGTPSDNTHSLTSPIILGKSYGVKTSTNFSFYDGKIGGGTAAVYDITKVANLQTGYELNDPTTTTEVIDTVTYHMLYGVQTGGYKINLNPMGGLISPSIVNLPIGDSITSATGLPTPTKGVYTFVGWYTDQAGNTPVTYPITASAIGETTFYAKWSFTPSNTPVNFTMTSDAVTEYFTNISTWAAAEEATPSQNHTTFTDHLEDTFNTYNCSVCNGTNNCSSPGSGTYCEQSKGYDTGIGDDLDVYLYDTTNNQIIGNSPVTYTTSTGGVIYNMIPGKTYKWVSQNDPSVYGFVTANGNRRTIYSPVRNVRDLGGLPVDTNNDGTIDGHIKYGILYRGAQLSASQADAASLTKLGITREIDLRSTAEANKNYTPAKLPVYDVGDYTDPNNVVGYEDVEIKNYLINPAATTYISQPHENEYKAFKKYLKAIMAYVAYGDESIFFHCTIGTDRTGTMAYFLEGLLGVPLEDRLEDYELSYYYGMTNRHRYHDYLSGSSINPRFESMYKSYSTYQQIYNFYTYEDEETNPQYDDDDLLDDFRAAMIE